MTALAADRKTVSKYTERSFTAKVAASTIIYAGALCARNAAGYIVPASDTAALLVVGVAQSSVDNSAGANGDLSVQCLTGVFKFKNLVGTEVVQATMHKACMVADDQTVGVTGVNSIVAGIVDQIDTDGVFVYVSGVTA